MKKIFKYPLSDAVTQFVNFPGSDCKILTVQIDNKTGRPCVWVIVDVPNEIRHRRRFFIIGTGWNLKDDLSIEGLDLSKEIYCGTIQNGDFVWHIFVETKIYP
jgi:hypothetical protein